AAPPFFGVLLCAFFVVCLLFSPPFSAPNGWDFFADKNSRAAGDLRPGAYVVQGSVPPQTAQQQVVPGPVQLAVQRGAGALGLRHGVDQAGAAPAAGQVVGAVAAFGAHLFQQGLQPGGTQGGGGLVAFQAVQRCGVPAQDVGHALGIDGQLG